MHFSRRTFVFAAMAATSISTNAMAQETVTYTYDALGRVTGVAHSGGPASGTTTTYTYDAANNRTNVIVANSPNGSGTNPNADSGASVPVIRFVVAPLNGYVLIPIIE